MYDTATVVYVCAVHDHCLHHQQQQQQQEAAPEPAYTGPRDVILVTDADSPTGELVTLQLILLR